MDEPLVYCMAAEGLGVQPQAWSAVEEGWGGRVEGAEVAGVGVVEGVVAAEVFVAVEVSDSVVVVVAVEVAAAVVVVVAVEVVAAVEPAAAVEVAVAAEAGGDAAEFDDLPQLLLGYESLDFPQTS